MTIYYDKLIDRYIPTDSGWNFHPDNTALLPSTEIDGKLVIEATNPLSTDYKQLMYSNISSGGNATVYYLDMITSKDSGALPKIMKDSAASNARAIELSPETTMIFRTNYPYNKDRLKKVLCRCRKEAGAPTLHVGVIGIEDKAYKQPDGTYGNNDFYEVTVSGDVTESYVTYVGYIAGTDTVENIELVSRPNRDPDYPAKLLDGTTDIALMIRTGSGTGSIYIDSIELQDTENALTELPKGAMVVSTIEGMADDDKLTPVEKNYLHTLMSEIDAAYGDEDGTPVVGLYYAGVQAGVAAAKLLELKTAYDALHTFIDPLLADLTSISEDIDGAVFDALFATYYAKKVAVEQDTANLNSAALSLVADTTVINVAVRGGTLITEQIAFTLKGMNINFSDVDWTRSDYGAPEDGFEYVYTALGEIDYTKRWIDCSTVLEDAITITVNYAIGNRTLSSTISLAKILSGTALPLYIGAVTSIPEVTEDGALIEKDFFLYVGNYIGVNTPPDPEEIPEDGIDTSETQDNEFIKGRMYRFTGVSTYECKIPQTASASIILEKGSEELFPVGMSLYIGEETVRRYVTSTAEYDASNFTVFVSGGVFDTVVGDVLYLDVWRESRNSSDMAVASKDALEIARTTNDWIYAAVVIAQLGLFNDLLVESKLSSTNYDEYKEEDRETNPASPNYNKIIGLDGKEHEVGEPKKGFRLDGPEDIIKAYAMEAYNSKIFGTVESTGFKTLTGTEPVTIPADYTPKTVWKYSDMFSKINDQETFYYISGTIDGFTFDMATKRFNTRIKIASASPYTRNFGAGDIATMGTIYPDFVFGRSIYVIARGRYEGNFSARSIGYNSMQLDTKPSTPLQIGADRGVISYLGKSFDYSPTLNMPTSEGLIKIQYGNNAWWGNATGYLYELSAYTSRTFNGLVLRNGNNTRVIEPKPNAYYPNTITWNIGANNQNTLSNYVSGTEFYNLFYQLPPIADGYVSAGKIEVKKIGQPSIEYTVTRLAKDGNGISFYTNLGVIRIDKFNEGTSSGVYEHLEITQDIEFKTVPDGIEVKSVLPWGAFIQDVENVTIGTDDARFESGFFKYLDILTNMLIRGTLNVTDVASVGSINTGGLGNFLIGQNLRTTDSPTFARVDTGFGANEVYKISEQTIAFGAVGADTDKTMSISAMDIKEIRTVNATGSIARNRDYTRYLYLKLPAGGIFFVAGQGSDLSYNSPHSTAGGVFSGGTIVAQVRSNSDDSTTFNVALIIRRIS